MKYVKVLLIVTHQQTTTTIFILFHQLKPSSSDRGRSFFSHEYFNSTESFLCKPIQLNYFSIKEKHFVLRNKQIQTHTDDEEARNHFK